MIARDGLVVLGVGGGALLAALVWGALRLGVAYADLGAAEARCADLVRDGRRIVALRGALPAVGHGRRSDADLITRGQRALMDAGLPISAIAGVQPRADLISAGGVRLQSIQLSLLALRPAEIGAWLAAWARPDQPWQVNELQLTHCSAPGPGGDPAGTGADANRYDAAVVLAAPYVEEAQ